MARGARRPGARLRPRRRSHLDSDLDLAERWLDVAAAGSRLWVDGLPLGYRRDFLRAIVGVNDVATAEAAALRAIDSAPEPRWKGVALAGLGQAQYLAVTTSRRSTPCSARWADPGCRPSVLTLAIGNLALAEYADGPGSSRRPTARPGPGDAPVDRAADLAHERDPPAGVG